MKSKLIIGSLALMLLIGIALGIWFGTRGGDGEPLIKVSQTKIDSTANRIMEIKSIGEWEFLTVSCEVLVDTVRKRGFLVPDDRLARIYRGTVRLGIDMADAADDWVKAEGDSAVILTLPDIKILDSRFIDEANTTSFYASGSWSGADREAMYRTAQRRMRAYAISADNLEAARAQARTRFSTLFRTLGYPTVTINFR